MPASICDPVTNALRLSLAPDESQNSSLLDSRLYSSAKNVLLSKIDFEESGDYQSNVLDGLKSKYVVIRPKKLMIENKLLKKDCISSSQTTGMYNEYVETNISTIFFITTDKINLEVIFLNSCQIILLCDLSHVS